MLRESRERCFSRATALAPASRSSCRYTESTTTVVPRKDQRRDETRPRRSACSAAQFFPPTGSGTRAAHGETREPPTLPDRHPSRARGFLVQQPPVPVVAIAPSRDSAAIMPRARMYAPSRGAGRRRVARSWTCVVNLSQIAPEYRGRAKTSYAANFTRCTSAAVNSGVKVVRRVIPFFSLSLWRRLRGVEFRQVRLARRAPGVISGRSSRSGRIFSLTEVRTARVMLISRLPFARLESSSRVNFCSRWEGRRGRGLISYKIEREGKGEREWEWEKCSPRRFA